MTKKPILTGTEVCVDGLGGQNVAVKNLSEGTVYASIFPNITADADNVVEIPAGSGEVVFDANGTVYLLGTGKVQCTGTPYATPNFRTAAYSGGESGGGGEVSKLYGKADFSFDPFDEHRTRIPVDKGNASGDIIRNFAEAFKSVLGERWTVSNPSSDIVYLKAKTDAYIRFDDQGNNKIRIMPMGVNGSGNASFSFDTSAEDIGIDVYMSKHNKIACITVYADQSRYMLHFVIVDPDTSTPSIWSRTSGSANDFNWTNNAGSILSMAVCNTHVDDINTCLGTSYSGMGEDMFNIHALCCDSQFMTEPEQVYMTLNGRKYLLFGRSGKMSDNSSLYHTVLAIWIGGD